MGRSPASSCLRIISCAGGDDGAEPTANALENKSSGDRRGWSFRKKSGKQRGLISSVVTETIPASRTRKTLESALLKSPSPDNNNVSEKRQLSVQCVDKKNIQLPVAYVAVPVDEKKIMSATELSVPCLEEQIDPRTKLHVPVESKEAETEEDDKTGTELQINSTIRKESDEEVDEKQVESGIIIIQAAIRGFLARRELLMRKKVDKLQAAVRGHLVRSQAMGSLRCVQAIVKMQTLVRARHSTKDGSRVSAVSGKVETRVSAQKILENKFAKHLMESTPKAKPISIKCDPTKPSSAWNWLERWMFVSKSERTSKANLATEEQLLEETQNVKLSSQVDIVNSYSALETKTETGFSSYEASKLEAQHVEGPDSLLDEPEYEDDQPKKSLQRKASNPSFTAVQSKFEGLTSCAGSNKAITLSSKDGNLGGESKTYIDSSEAEATYSKQDYFVEDVAPAELSGSECGTQLSVTSSLDTLDKKSDVEGAEPKFETKLFECGTQLSVTSSLDTLDKKSDVEGAEPKFETKLFENGTQLSVTSSLDTLDKKSDVEGAEPKFETKLFENGTIKTDQAELIEIDVKYKTPLFTVEDPKEKVDYVGDEVQISAPQHESVINTPDSKKRQVEDESGHQAYPLPEEPLTPMIITEFEATPASQTSSVKASGLSQKRKVSKKITSSPKQESGTGQANTTEQQDGKEQKSGKRNSFGLEQEARENSGGKNSLPRFMQPTQSAKAKVQEHNSPRSSPDIQERDVSVKKRHSLPVVANGKQSSSPRIQRSASQAQQGTKDRKWHR